jgi:hypothetical protein
MNQQPQINIDKYAQKYRELAEFLGSSLHKEWAKEHATAEAALIAQVSRLSPQELHTIDSQLAALFNEDLPNRTILLIMKEKFNVYYRPTFDMLTASQWLFNIMRLIEKHGPFYRSKFPQIGQLLGAYFHEDWPDFDNDWPDVVRRYISETSPDYRAKTIAELKEFLNLGLSDEQLLSALLNDFHSGLDPSNPAFNTPAKQWLQQVLEMLEKAET